MRLQCVTERETRGDWSRIEQRPVPSVPPACLPQPKDLPSWSPLSLLSPQERTLHVWWLENSLAHSAAKAARVALSRLARECGSGSSGPCPIITAFDPLQKS